MNNVVQYIFFFLIGTTILNFMIAVAARAKTGNREFNKLILYWVSLFCTYGAVAALSKSETQIAFAFFFQFIPSFLAIKILRDSANLKSNWRKYLGIQAIAMGISSWLILKTDLGFTLSLMPVILSTSYPFLISSFEVLILHWNDANWIEKGMGFLFISTIVNNFNYALFRLDESAAWWGWSVSIAQYQCLSIFLPLLINHRREIKERKNLELALQKLSGLQPVSPVTEIDELYRTLELQISQKEEYSRQLSEMNRHLEEEREMNEILIKTISHDLASPLTVVSAYLDMIQTGRIAADEVDKIQNRMRQNLKSAVDMIARIRKTIVQRSDADLIKLVPVDLSIALKRAEMLFDERIRNKNIKLKMTIPENGLRISADENALVEHVFANIISNAIKFSYENGEIEIDVKEHESTVEIEFRDHGVGINPSRSEKSRFISTPGTQGEEGTGFGLIVMGYFLRKFKADLKIVPHTSQGARGTSFIVILKKPFTTSLDSPFENANFFS